MCMCDELRMMLGKFKGEATALVSHTIRQALSRGDTPDGKKVRPIVSPRLVAVTAVVRARVSMVSSLDSGRFAEAQFYLATYGTPGTIHSSLTSYFTPSRSDVLTAFADMMVTFLMRHGFLELSLKHILKHNLPTSLFMEKVFVPCVSSDRLGELERALQPLDSWMPFLRAACELAHASDALHLLYSLEIMMKKYTKAGLTRVRIAAGPGIVQY